MRNFKVITSIFLSILSFYGVKAQTGKLDVKFGDNGLVVHQVSVDDNDRSHDIAFQKDGKIVAVGYSHNEIDSTKTRRMAVTRYQSSGALDSTFGLNGAVILDLDSLNPLGSGWSEASSVVIQKDGKIVVGGKFRDEFTVVRLNKDGNLDVTFGKGGVVITSIEESSGITDLHLLNDGEILAVGYCVLSRNSKIAIAQYSEDGGLDISFGKEGIVTTKVNDNLHSINAVDIQKDGKIVVAGMVATVSFGLSEKNDDFLLLRYNKDGSLDEEFGDNGISIRGLNNGNDRAKDVVVQEDGKIVAVGFGHIDKDASNPQHAIARFLPDGSFDTEFAGSGYVLTKVGSSYDEALAVVLQPDKKILVAGNASGGVGFDGGAMTLLRYDVDGKLDDGFADGGIALTGRDGVDFFGTSILMQEDKKIVVGGYADNSISDFAVARFFSGLEVGILTFSKSNLNPRVYPNPVSINSIISYELQEDETITISLVNLEGKMVQRLASKVVQRKGKHNFKLNISESVESGNYILRLCSPKGSMGVQILID